MARDDDVLVSDLAARRAKSFTDLAWHIGAFVILNAMFWALDLFVGQPGLQWAYWITAFWGLALAFHVLAYLIDGRQVERRRAERYSREMSDTQAHHA
jgi:hypothetical protein